MLANVQEKKPAYRPLLLDSAGKCYRLSPPHVTHIVIDDHREGNRREGEFSAQDRPGREVAVFLATAR